MEGVPVRLGTFVTATDDRGHYVFSKVPPGQFELKVAEEWLPAQYASDRVTHQLVIRGATRRTVDFTVVPLDSLRGRVYQDLNGNGRYDAGEGRFGVVVYLGPEITATNLEGAYGCRRRVQPPTGRRARDGEVRGDGALNFLRTVGAPPP